MISWQYKRSDPLDYEAVNPFVRAGVGSWKSIWGKRAWGYFTQGRGEIWELKRPHLLRHFPLVDTCKRDILWLPWPWKDRIAQLHTPVTMEVFRSLLLSGIWPAWKNFNREEVYDVTLLELSPLKPLWYQAKGCSVDQLLIGPILIIPWKSVCKLNC